MIERFIAANAPRERAVPNDSERDGGEPWPKTAAAACAEACDAATGTKRENSGSKSEAAVTANAAAAITARFARVASISAPAGVWAMRPAAVAIDIATPMLASSHFWIVSK
jgi:hypothetical protein